MSIEKLANDIIEKVGGEANIKDVTHCMTRLRFHLVDDSKVQEKDLRALKGVMATANQAGQYQVILGNDVAAVFKALPVEHKKNTSPQQTPKKRKNIINIFFETLTSIFTPLLPALIGAGMTKAFLSLFAALSWLDSASTVYVVLNNLGDTVFYFMPVLVGYTAAKRFGSNQYIGAVLGAFLINPTIMTLLTSEANASFLGVPIIAGTYSASVIPSILAALVLKYVEDFLTKVTPKILKIFVVPTVSLIIVGVLTLLFIGPIGTVVGSYIASAFAFLNENAPWLLPMLFGGLSPLLIMTGMHHAILPVAMPVFLANGYETFVTPGMFVSALALAASAFAVSFKTKNKELKQTALSTGITSMMGITEPVLYGIAIPYKTPLIASIIGGSLAGLFAGIMKVYAYGIGGGITSLPIYIGGEGMTNFYLAIVSGLIAIVTSFVATYFMKLDDTDPKDNRTGNDNTVFAPLSGNVVPLDAINDETFSSGVMGPGVGIKPENGFVFAPIAGTVTALFPTKHALGITASNGIEVLIHIGIDTVKLDGKYFDALIAQGDAVEVGTPLVTFDKAAIEHEGYDLTTAVIVTNKSATLSDIRDASIHHGAVLFTVKLGHE